MQALLTDKHPQVLTFYTNLLLIFVILAPDIEQATVTLATNFTGTLNISRALFSLLRPHSRVVNVSSSAGFLSRSAANIQVNEQYSIIYNTRCFSSTGQVH